MKKTAVELLFEEFKALSKVARDAGDEQSANLIDFLCEREQVAKETEKEQIIYAHGVQMVGVNNHKCVTGEQYYKETYKQD
jgi:hypothetical protein